ncbi:hypothetical protein [Paenibacillus sp. DMB20]|uniref:hypothetical protein n=1 Tax=Paenibacillus sp. DMB20 TaxID=1642570 RepID=UPI000AF1D5D5|nr:hypothetical protein [Paenibacillus sp. DMB20]
MNIKLLVREGNTIHLNNAESWIKRYIDADMKVSRRINADIREAIGIDITREQHQVLCLIHNRERCTSTFFGGCSVCREELDYVHCQSPGGAGLDRKGT